MRLTIKKHQAITNVADCDMGWGSLSTLVRVQYGGWLAYARATVITTIMVVAFGFVARAAADVQADGVFINLHIKKHGKSVAAAMVGVAYYDEQHERTLMQYLKPETEFTTVGNIFDEKQVLIELKEAKTRTLKGDVSVELTLATEKKPEDVLQLDELTLSYKGSSLYADKYKVTKWSLSETEVERIRKVWERKRAVRKR